jgi:predicted AlkP superfamily pyrophosphatase or phosphodiesterase
VLFRSNDLVPGYLPGSRQWKPLRDDLGRVTFDPPEAWPLKNTRYGGTFPHPVSDARSLTYSPFGHELLFDFALHVLLTDKPDLFFVSVSSTDNLGHYYGPDSMEVADSMVRLDRALANFLDALERHGGDDLTVILTSDHGVQPIPEITRLRNPRADVGRLDLRNPDPNATTIRDLPPLRREIERRLARRLGLPFREDMPLRNALVYFFEGTGLYLNHRRIADLARAKRELRDILRSIDGVAGAWTSGEPLPPLVANSFHPTRSGDVLVALKPGWIWHWGSNSTTHGQPVDDDLRVPLLVWGKGAPALLPPMHDGPQPR